MANPLPLPQEIDQKTKINFGQIHWSHLNEKEFAKNPNQDCLFFKYPNTQTYIRDQSR